MYLREASRRLKKPPAISEAKGQYGWFLQRKRGERLKAAREGRTGALPMRLEVMNVMVSSSLYL